MQSTARKRPARRNVASGQTVLQSHGCQAGAVDIDGVAGGCSRRHYHLDPIPKGTLMRHFLRTTLTPSALPSGVSTGAAMAQLVTHARPA